MDDLNYSNRRTRNHRNRPWGDLPQDILVSIHNELHFVDQIQFRAVCKNWRITKDFIRCPDNLPWVLLKFSWMKSAADTNNRYPFECKFFDPYSQKTFNVSNYIEHSRNLDNSLGYETTFYASKYGWSLFGKTGNSSLLFLHNLFTNEVIVLPRLDLICKTATFTMNPTSPDCEILVFCVSYKRGENCRTLNVGRCRLSNREWSVKFLEIITREPHSMCFMNGELYCVFGEGMLKSYNLTTKIWKPVTKSLPQPFRYNGTGRCWLIEKENDLELVRARFLYSKCVWSVYKMDWSTMSWSEEPNLDNVAFFNSGKTSLSTALGDYDGKILRASLKLVHIVAYEDKYGRGSKCYFSKHTWQENLRDGGSWIGNSPSGLIFIEPPYVRN